MSHRAIETLTKVDLIACEDTRHTKNLCRYLQITTPLTSYFREKEQEKAEQLLQMLLAGKHIALVSDAGTPAISDPGAILVKKSREAGIDVVAIAGPAALTAALSIAGLTQTNFFFGGFLPANRNERQKFLHSIATLPFTLVFYESPHRINATLTDMGEFLGDRPAQLFRELTKIHEECLQGTLSSLINHVQEGIKGELVLIVQGAADRRSEKPDNIDELLLWYRDELQSSLKDAVRNIAADLDLPRSQVYKKALSIWKNDQ
jgi:16S rRNA (cytidine1402-2'-O)-methyltransferase